MTNNQIVNAAIDATKAYLGDYFENTCCQRLAGGAGSCFSGVKTVEEMEHLLREANWDKAEHPDVIPGCQAYVTSDLSGGRFGLVRIAELPEDTTLVASDPKSTGRVSMTVRGLLGPEVKETWLIIGKEDVGGVARDVVYTFHPGEPVRPSLVEVKDCPDGTSLTKAQALALGFELAKVC